jgi:hypothetical protein
MECTKVIKDDDCTFDRPWSYCGLVGEAEPNRNSVAHQQNWVDAQLGAHKCSHLINPRIAVAVAPRLAIVKRYGRKQ